jgi:hypothetical protein
MVASGEVLVVRTVASAGLRGAVGNRLSPIVKALSPSAKTCHHLPSPAITCQFFEAGLAGDVSSQL